MFGERYFATRKKLSRVVGDVRGLARSTGTELNGFADDSELLQGLKNPFLFVVCGEVNAGKSTLINGLFGAAMCETNILPQTDKVMWYRYGEEVRDEEITPVLEERYRPIDFLHDFNIVDTPGTNSVMRGHQAITERFLPVADLVLFVFPVSNPWGAATWDFIAKFPEALHGKVAFVLQQKDLRDDKELAIIMEHMRQLALQKLGEKPQVFAVSGLMALEAKRRQPFEERAWRGSGYPDLEAFISHVVTNSPGRRQVLRDVRDATSGALRRIEEQIEDRTRLVGIHESFLRDLDAEVDQLRDDYSQETDGKFGGLAEVFSDEGDEALVVLKRGVRLFPTLRSLFVRDDSPAAMEKSLSEAVQQAVQELAGVDGDYIEELCWKHWQRTTPLIEEKLGLTAPPIDGGDCDMQGTKEQFVKRLGRGARQAVTGLKLRGVLEMQLESRRAVLRRFVAGALLLVSLGGALGAAGVHPWSWITMGVAGLAGVIGVWQSRRSGVAIMEWFRERLGRARTGFAEAMTPDYLEGVRRFFSDYSRLIDVVRREVAKSKNELKPRQDEWNDLFVELKAIEQEL